MFTLGFKPTPPKKGRTMVVSASYRATYHGNESSGEQTISMLSWPPEREKKRVVSERERERERDAAATAKVSIQMLLLTN
jgi:hypothetical protein